MTDIPALIKLPAAEFLRCLARRQGGVHGEDTASLFDAADEIDRLRKLLVDLYPIMKAEHDACGGHFSTEDLERVRRAIAGKPLADAVSDKRIVRHGAVIGTCGHELVDERVDLALQGFDPDGRVVIYGMYCGSCAEKERRSGAVLETTEQEDAWLRGETWSLDKLVSAVIDAYRAAPNYESDIREAVKAAIVRSGWSND